MTPPASGPPPDDEHDEPSEERREDGENGSTRSRSPPDSDEENTSNRADESARDRETGAPLRADPDGSNGVWGAVDDRGNSLLSSLLQALESFDRISSTGDRRRRMGYDDSVEGGSGGSDSRPGRAVGAGRSETNRQTRRRPPSSIPTSVQEVDGRLTVTADVAGVDPDAVTVGLDDGRLVIGVEGSAIERVPVPWSDATTDARLNNGVLSVTVEPGTGERTWKRTRGQ